jgi:triacylglycerol lipase
VKRKVYLAPGFFGFTSLGGLNYFHRVADALSESLARRGLDADIIECATQPTGSIRRRTIKVIDDVVASGGLDAQEIHFVGHSTGGLDVRLAVTPGVRLRPGRTEGAEIAARTRSVITISTPHFGTPLANHFTTISGRHLLEVATILATTSGGRYAVFALSRALKAVHRIDSWLGREHTFLDQWVDNLLDKVTLDRNDPIWAFLRDVSEDQGAIIQLTPESMNLFNAAVVDRPGVRYSSLVTVAPPPPFHYEARRLVKAPPKAALAVVFSILYHLAAREHRHYPYPHPGEHVLAGWEGKVPHALDPKANDGIVPSLSQVYGRVLDVAVADHLDVVGQFESESLYTDWLPSGSKYREDEFLATWDAVAAEIAAASLGDHAELPAREGQVTVQSAEQTAGRPAPVE